MNTVAPTWAVRHLTGQAYGCTLAVTWRGPDQWIWLVTVADHHIGNGVARTMQAAQDEAVRVAKQHAACDGIVQMNLF
ncbi:hypothetical protein [Azospirillum canadense]|uniref:hypothetical protein n=1 Tax=Azospirillum canadense TaxID=403962 RepID=UPI0022273E87|nr:hypothetical protein [Azospirillum canadense]MCW2240657.1 hypothetical protein [Azospirillum canadense]